MNLLRICQNLSFSPTSPQAISYAIIIFHALFSIIFHIPIVFHYFSFIFHQPIIFHLFSTNPLFSRIFSFIFHHPLFSNFFSTYPSLPCAFAGRTTERTVAAPFASGLSHHATRCSIVSNYMGCTHDECV